MIKDILYTLKGNSCARKLPGKSINDTRYESQALALVLIIVLICALIALALVSRTLKQNARVAEETLSSGAIEVSDSLVEISKSIEIDDIVDKCPEFGSGKECCFAGGNLTQFDGIDPVIVKESLNCPGETNTTAELCFKQTSDQDGFNISKDETLNLNVKSTVSTPGCTANIKLTPTLQTSSGAIISRFEGGRDVNGEVISVVENGPDNIVGLKINGDTNWSGSWISYNQSTGYNLPVVTNSLGTGNTISVRIKALGSDMNVKIESTCIFFDPKVIVVASTNCGGTYRANYYYKDLVPSAPSLFDFVLYNGYGDLTYTE
ncbi:MAG TPA: hypothetical protein PLX79_02325 [Candidatus Dojkabacteria bacterium]|nr:hypothetical protein [Candidatus Dojkabacteria bacterium]